MKVLREYSDASLFYDQSNNIVKFVWNGVVSLETLKDLVLVTAEIVDNNNQSYLLFDRRELETYAPDAKDWIKNDFMKGDGKRLMKKIGKIGAISSKSTFAQLVSTLLMGVLKLYNRNMQYKMFDTPEQAIQWLKEKEAVAQ